MFPKKKRKITDINIWALALVDKGANKRRFFLTKRDENFFHKTQLPVSEQVADSESVNKKDFAMDEIKKMTGETAEVLKNCIGLLEKAQTKEDVAQALSLLKTVAEKNPEAFAVKPAEGQPEPEAKTTKEAVEKLAVRIEKSSDIGDEAKKSAKENLEGLKASLGYIQKRDDGQEISAEEAGKILAQSVADELKTVLA